MHAAWRARSNKDAAMSKVHNWHLNRDMEYPYEGSRPSRQIAYIFDTNKCIAC